jgi:hypothetical protein
MTPNPLIAVLLFTSLSVRFGVAAGSSLPLATGATIIRKGKVLRPTSACEHKEPGVAR